jgi:tetratricopeptide (TPR) repeat protein
LFRRLAVFRGGFSLEGVERTCQASEGESVLATFESLVEKNLQHRVAVKGEPWYVMLETIREFAEQRLDENGEADSIRLRHARYYLQMAEEAEPHIDRSTGVEWTTRLEREYLNLRSATEWAAPHELEIALRIAAALTRFIAVRMLWLEQRDLLNRLLTICRATSAPGLERWRAKLLSSFCNQSLAPWSARQSVTAAEEGVYLWRRIGDKRGLGNGLLLLGLARAFDARDPSPVLALLGESSDLQREIGDQMGLSHTTFYQGLFTHIGGDSRKARTIAEECLEVARNAGDVARFAAAFSLLALIATDAGEYQHAQSLAERSVGHYRQTNDKTGLFLALSSLGGIALLRGDTASAASTYAKAFEVNWNYARFMEKVCIGLLRLREERLEGAFASFAEGIELLRSMDSRWSAQCTCACLAGIADVRAAESLKNAAAILGGIESTLFEPFGRLAWGYDFTVTPTLIRLEFERIRKRVSQALGDSADTALNAGRGLRLEKLIDIALYRK